MKWVYSVKNKMMAASTLALVLGLVLFNNLSERENSQKINRAIYSIYDDRLVAETCIFNYLNHSHQIIEVIDDKSQPLYRQRAEIQSHLGKIRKIHEDFTQTTFTELESEDFVKLTDLYAAMEAATATGNLPEVKRSAKNSVGVLEELSQIQLAEAENQIKEIKRINSSSTIHSYMEFGILIVLAVFIQGLVLASKTLNEEVVNSNPSLN